MKIKKVLKEIKYKAGYIVKHELISGKEYGSKDVILKSAYNLNNNYIGDSKWAYRCCKLKGIKPELRTKDSKTCSVGFSEKDNKWYGWSHRAICGFQIGDIVKKGDCYASSGFTEEYIKEHPEEDVSLPIGFKAKNLNDCKKMAIAFAESVS